MKQVKLKSVSHVTETSQVKVGVTRNYWTQLLTGEKSSGLQLLV
jgi:hypothetical protein